MSILKRLKELEKKMSQSYYCNVLEIELLAWLNAHPYKVENYFHEWCEKIPKYLVPSFAEYIKKNVRFQTLMDNFKDLKSN